MAHPNEFIGGVMRDESGAIIAIQWDNLSPENKHLARWEHEPIGPGHPLSDSYVSEPVVDAAAGDGAAAPAAAPASAPAAVSDDDESSGSEGEGAGGAGGSGGGGGSAAAAAPGAPDWGPEDHELVATGKSKSACMVEGCTTKLVAKKVSMVANALLWAVLVPVRPFKKRSNRHTCRSCKKKVCGAHFTNAPGGMKICSECSKKGVDGPASSN